MTDTTSPAPALSEVPSDTSAPGATPRLGWVLGLTSTAYFMVALDALVVVTALPLMHRDLHVGLSALQWTVNSYGITFAAGIITAAAPRGPARPPASPMASSPPSPCA